jgi:hypothetical protein
LKRILTVFCLLFLAFGAFAKQPGYSTDDVVAYALKNAQQEGNFYFLPIYIGAPYNGHTEYLMAIGPEAVIKGELAGRMQTILRILDGLEKERKVDVIHFELVRDANNARGYYSNPYQPAYTYGLLVKALPKKGAAK